MARRHVGLVSAGVVVAGLLAGSPAATAAEPTPDSATESPATRATPSRFSDGRYVVVLRQPGSTRAGATRAASGQSFRADSDAVRAYERRLRVSHDRIADEVGTDVATHYTTALNGFAADLTTEQAVELSSDRRVLLVERDQLRYGDTWNTPELLGLSGKKGVWARYGGQKRAGAGTVVGILDSGIWPESESFRGKPLTERPQTKWDISRQGGVIRVEKADGGVFTGSCEAGDEWTADDCNTKLVGARHYADGLLAGGGEIIESDWLSPRDGNGHGTHTASTSAGAIVTGVQVEDVEFGTATGMAPGARIAAYKVLWATEDGRASGTTSDIVAAIDDAVSDGVDVINFSISGALDTVLDATEIAFEGAAEAGIFTAASAGNSGPDASTVAHNSPWLTTVAAATHFNFENTVVLGNGEKFAGASIANRPLPSSPLVTAEASVVDGGDAADAALCGPDTLDPAAVTGTIVVCLRGAYDRVAKSAEVDRAGGVGMVMVNTSEGQSLDADFHSVPSVHLDAAAGEQVLAYVAAQGEAATAKFVVGNTTGTPTPLPQVSGFSSRGPSLANDADILKPDIAAPGTSILAAVAPPSNSDRSYDLYSGTSMSAPHIAGLAAFMAAVHPKWTPQQIQSAMMTTATPLKDANGADSTDAMAQGAGMVNPRRFFNPGLFVTSTPREWQRYLAGVGYQPNPGFPLEPIAAQDINLPSMSKGQLTASATFTRRFVAARKGTWKITSDVPGFEVTMDKTRVVSQRRWDAEDVTFTFARTDAPLGEVTSGHVTLTGPTTVRLPVALRPVSVKAPAAVEGEGVEGSVAVPVTAGFTGELNVGVTGLAVSDTVSTEVAAGDYDLQCVTVAEGSEAARFAIDAVDDTADLDMYVYAAETCDPGTIFAEAGSSATGSADEALTLLAPEAGAYFVEIDGFAAGEQGDPIAFDFDFWDVNPAAEVGDLTATPNPVPVTNQQETTFDVSWSGLEADRKYLGVLEYEGSLAPTLVFVTG